MEIRIKSDDLLTVSKAAKQLGRGKMTLYQWIKAGKIIYVELGGVLFIPKSVVERLKKGETMPEQLAKAVEES